VSLKALAGEPFVLTPRYQGAGLRDKIVEHCRQAGFEPRVVQEAWLMQTTVSLVAGGIGVTLVPASLQNLQRAGVLYKYVEGLSPEIELGAVWRRGDPSAVLRAFLGVVGDVTRWGEGEPEEEASTGLPRGRLGGVIPDRSSTGLPRRLPSPTRLRRDT
jgi:DNA-binding transcriptional LysR family regulator